jgi:hypothetical protein
MHGDGLAGIDLTQAYWVPAVVAPMRDWVAVPGCRRGARFVLDPETGRPGRAPAGRFGCRGECLQWIMAHRQELREGLPGAEVRPVNLARWLLGLD